VAARHAADHIHIVATLARQDGIRPKFWNDFYRVREGCQEAERRLGLRRTAPADRTAARRATRAETEQAARRGWAEPPRATLRREVCTAAAGAAIEREFFARLRQAGVLVRLRFSQTGPGQVTGYAVTLPGHTGPDGAADAAWATADTLHAVTKARRASYPKSAGALLSGGRLGYVLAHPGSADLMSVAYLREQVRRLDEQYDRAPSTALIPDAGQHLGSISFLGMHARRSYVGRELYPAGPGRRR
jgi:hypothetical protein